MNHVLSWKDWSILRERMSRTYDSPDGAWRKALEVVITSCWIPERSLPRTEDETTKGTESTCLCRLWLCIRSEQQKEYHRLPCHDWQLSDCMAIKETEQHHTIEHQGQTCGNEHMCDSDQVCCIPHDWNIQTSATILPSIVKKDNTGCASSQWTISRSHQDWNTSTFE